jgi:hypothetical protein
VSNCLHEAVGPWTCFCSLGCCDHLERQSSAPCEMLSAETQQMQFFPFLRRFNTTATTTKTFSPKQVGVGNAVPRKFNGRDIYLQCSYFA